MKYVHVRNLDKYQPGYKDRDHIWAKIYYRMLIDPDTRLLSEVNFARFVKLIVVETYLKKPLPLSEKYLSGLQFDFGLECLDSTLNELSHLIEIIDVTENKNGVFPRGEESREEKKREEIAHSRFSKPNLNDLKEAFKTGGLETSLAEREACAFLDYYESVGWVVGRTRKPMKSWRGAVSTWLRNRATDATGAAKPVKREPKPNPHCEMCHGGGKLPDGKPCWCWS